MALAPTTAWSASVGLTGGLSRTPTTDSSPASGSTSLGLTGFWDPSDRWSFDGGWGLSLPRGAADKDNPLYSKEVQRGIHSLSLGATWIPGAGQTTVTVDEDGETDEEDVPYHWSFGGSLAFSPKNTSRTATTLTMEDTVAGKTSTYDAPTLLQVSSSSLGVTLWTGWETGGTSSYESEVSLSAGLNAVTTKQSVEEFIGRNGTLTTTKQLMDLCSGGTTPKTAKLCKRLNPLLKAQDATLAVIPISLNFVETLYRNTDVSLAATYYAYSKDPNEVGYFSLATQGKKAPNGETVNGSSASFGTGIAVAPFDWSTSAGVSHKLGALRLSANVGYSHYYGDLGHYTSFGLRANYKVAEHFRVLASAATQNDVDTDGAGTRSWSGSLTVKYLF